MAIYLLAPTFALHKRTQSVFVLSTVRPVEAFFRLRGEVSPTDRLRRSPTGTVRGETDQGQEGVQVRFSRVVRDRLPATSMPCVPGNRRKHVIIT